MSIINNTATIQNSEGYAVSNTTTWNLISVLPYLTLTKSPDNLSVIPGEKETITITCKNNGSSTYSNYSIYDSLDTKTKFIDGSVTIDGNYATSGQYKYEGNTLVVTPGKNLDANGTVTITFQVEILTL